MFGQCALINGELWENSTTNGRFFGQCIEIYLIIEALFGNHLGQVEGFLGSAFE